MASEEEGRDGANTVYRMKVVQFLDRSVPIILQNDNGPCPLLAISNVLLLRNNVTLGIDALEISQGELMALVADWLIEANSNIQNKDDVYVKNQQRNIGDAMQLLPRLATGIDVNVRFRHIHDFEYTPECAIFDLFHVGLVHGWLCDPQDKDCFRVIGSHSYNTLVEKLVALDKSSKQPSTKPPTDEEQPVDFGAATIAALGIPTPHTKILSDEEFEAFNQAESGARRKGDEEEAAELLQALRLSQTNNDDSDLTSPREESPSPRFPINEGKADSETGVPHLEIKSIVHVDKDGVETLVKQDEAVTMRRGDESTLLKKEDVPEITITSIVHFQKEGDTSLDTKEVSEKEFVLTSETTSEGFEVVPVDHQSPSLKLPLTSKIEEDCSPKKTSEVSGQESPSLSGQPEGFSFEKGESSSISEDGERKKSIFTVGEEVKTVVEPLDLSPSVHEDQNLSNSGSAGSSFEHIRPKGDSLPIGTGSGRVSEEAEDCASSGLDEDEPLYEGEPTLTEAAEKNDNIEPLYQGEGITSGSAERPGPTEGSGQLDSQTSGDENLNFEGLIIENFLDTTASQLTYHGLFSLQDGLKDNELYVFFRNNHFSTLFKHDGQIYLLATDQGYLAQPDLVWEKLTEVDGDTMFFTGSFQQFHIDQSSENWNERDALAATTDFMSAQHVSGAITEGANYNSDLQLAMALQQQELAQQQQQQQQQQEQQQQARMPTSAPRTSQASPKSSAMGDNRLGPARGSAVAPSRTERARDKCTIM